jgi:hypothetical protein
MTGHTDARTHAHEHVRDVYIISVFPFFLGRKVDKVD